MEMAQAVAANARRIRGAATMAEVSDAARLYGAKWTSGTVAKIEAGKTRPTIETLILLMCALRWTTGNPVTMTDLLQSDQPIRISDTYSATSEVIIWALAGNEFDDDHNIEPTDLQSLVSDARSIGSDTPRAVREQFLATGDLPEVAAVTEQERRVAHDLEVAPVVLQYWAVHLWQRPFEDERDRRAGPDANAQKRGRVTRQLKAEIQSAIEAQHGDD